MLERRLLLNKQCKVLINKKCQQEWLKIRKEQWSSGYLPNWPIAAVYGEGGGDVEEQCSVGCLNDWPDLCPRKVGVHT